MGIKLIQFKFQTKQGEIRWLPDTFRYRAYNLISAEFYKTFPVPQLLVVVRLSQFPHLYPSIVLIKLTILFIIWAYEKKKGKKKKN